MTFIAGGYTATYHGVTIGQAESGFSLEHFVNKQLITGDAEGRTPQDAVFQGHEYFVNLVLSKYALLKAQLLFWPYSTTGAGASETAVFGNNGVIGSMDVASGHARELILTAITDTTSETQPGTLTAPLAIIAEDVPIRIPIGPELRDIPITLRLYPSAGAFFTTASSGAVPAAGDTGKFIAGAMAALYNGMSVGQIRDALIEFVPRKRLVTGDSQGSTPQDAVYQGMEVHIEFTMLEWDESSTQAAFWPYDGTWGTQGVVGRTDVESAIAKALVLTETVGTTAENTPNTFTAARAVLAEGFPVEMLLAPDLREVPIRMRLYPEDGDFFITA